jgi:hypothetical protein
MPSPPLRATSVTGASASCAASAEAIRSDRRISTGMTVASDGSGDRCSARWSAITSRSAASSSGSRRSSSSRVCSRVAGRSPCSSASQTRPGSATSFTQRLASHGAGGPAQAGNAKRHQKTSSNQAAMRCSWASAGRGGGRRSGPCSCRHVCVFPPSSSGRCSVRTPSVDARGPPNATPS